MSSYKNSLVFTLLLTTFIGCSNDSLNLKIKEDKKLPTVQKSIDTKYYDLEDHYIMFALEYESHGNYLNARNLYKELFQKTNKYEYLEKFASLSFHQKDYRSVVNIIDSKILNELTTLKQEESILRLYAFSLMKVGKENDSIIIANKILDINPSAVNHELLGSIYLDSKKYKKSYEEFLNSFNITNSASSLLTLTNIQYFYLNENKEAKEKIESYFEKNGYSYALSLQLLTFYEKDKEKDKLINLLKDMYSTFKLENKHIAYTKTRDLILRYLVKDDIQAAIDFVKENNESDEILLSLYKSANRIDDAYNLLQKMYQESSNYKYLGEIAILEFETATNKEKVLNSVIVKFEKTLENISNHVFENYLAYILIDYEKDVKKGIKLVNKALKVQPDNLAYIDTLAWGEYKLRNCSKAYELMKQVVDKTGLEDKEIKLHWEKIKECSK